MIGQRITQQENKTTNRLKVVSWNINGVTGKREYLKLLMEQSKPDIVFLTETKRQHTISMFSELACGDDYRVVQVKSTSTNRGGMIAIIKTKLQLITAEIRKVQEDNDFAQAIILTDKDEKAYIGWYSSPVMSKDAFHDTLEKIYKDYDVQFCTGDFNARHPRWCTHHDNNGRGKQLLKLIQEFPEYQIHATPQHTFEAIASKAKGTKRTSTVDLVVSRVTVKDLKRITGYVAVCSDHYPIVFTAETQVETAIRPRRIAKTLLQSEQHRAAIGLLYEVSLRKPEEDLRKLRSGEVGTPQTEEIQAVYSKAEHSINEPWIQQTKKRRRRCGAHVNAGLLRLWCKKRKLYERMKYWPTSQNKLAYKQACALTQRRERQLEREHDRRNCQRIQYDPNTAIAKALQSSTQKRRRQQALDRATGKQLKPKQFAEYLGNMMNLGQQEALVPREFKVNEEQHSANLIMAIKDMDNNKAVGVDGTHVEMLKSNPRQTAKLLTEIWKTVGETRIIPRNWLRGIVVPLYKGKGESAKPKNYRPLTILSHLRKLTEKAVVLELEKVITTDRSQFGFQAGLQVTQAALSVLAALKTVAKFLSILDLAKAYDSVIKALLLQKLEDKVDTNLVSQLLVFLLTVRAFVAGDITKTEIIMQKGLTQGGTSSLALFKLFMYDLPEQIREEMRDNDKDISELDPIRLVADDIVIPAKDKNSLQVALNASHKWAETNHQKWNPTKSQVLDMEPGTEVKESVHLGGVELKWATEVEYLGLRLSKDGFLGKTPAHVEEKCRAALHMLTNEKWFNLNL